MVELPQKAASGKLYHVRIDVGVPNRELVVKHSPSPHGRLQHMQEEKSRVEARSVLVEKSPARAIHEAFQEMGRRLQDYARRQQGAVKTKHLTKAILKGLQDQYGFLETHDGRTIYLNEASLIGGHFAKLRVGTQVRFDEEMGEKGPQATTIRIVHPRKQSKAAASLPSAV